MANKTENLKNNQIKKFHTSCIKLHKAIKRKKLQKEWLSEKLESFKINAHG